MMVKDPEIGSSLRNYIYVLSGECVGCIEVEIAQDLSGQKIAVVTDAHEGPGYISTGATSKLPAPGLTDDEFCTLPPSQARSNEKCARCWFNPSNQAKALYGRETQQ